MSKPTTCMVASEPPSHKSRDTAHMTKAVK